MNRIDFFEKKHYYTNNDLKILFRDKIQKEVQKIDPEDGYIMSQKLIPIKSFNPETGKFRVVDVKIINYVVTKDGKIQVIFEGENLSKLKTRKVEEKAEVKKEEETEKGNIKKIVNNQSTPERALTYMCSNGETQDGLVTKITPTESFVHVSFHEQQHLIARNIEAFLNDEKIFLEYIRLYTRFDPVTGKIYVAGGRAVTIKGKTINPKPLLPTLFLKSQNLLSIQ